jgi:hypothetical protein
MSLPTGSWNVNGNGFLGTLSIDSIDANGNVSGTVFNERMQGFWDESAQKLTFTRVINQADPSTMQIYTGCMFQNANTFTIAGTFQAFSGTGANPMRSVFGWFAQHPTT